MYQLYFDDRRRSQGPVAAPAVDSLAPRTRSKRFSLDPRLLKQMVSMKGGMKNYPNFDFNVSL